MKRFVAGADRGQSTLLPECIEDWVDESNLVRRNVTTRRSTTIFAFDLRMPVKVIDCAILGPAPVKLTRSVRTHQHGEAPRPRSESLRPSLIPSEPSLVQVEPS
jgi:hypothetical protein